MTKIILWSLIAIIALDIVINLATEIPKNNIKPGKLSQYFDYGRSIESKLFRKVSNNNETADALTKAGWFELLENSKLDKNPTKTKKRVFIYGMSFSNHIGEIISKQDKTLDVKMFAGPGAPLNHSYSYYQYHRPHRKGDIVILGILASSLPMINTLTHMTSNFEGPAAHFYPRYRLNTNNKLIKKQIPINSLSELRIAMHNEKQWAQVKDTLKKEDFFYNEILFSKNITDKSVYFRLIKRAWGQRIKLKQVQRYHDETGFNNTDRLIDISQIIVRTFAQQVRKDGAFPIIILFNDRGYNDHLYSILKIILKEDRIPYYSTHVDFPASQLSNFLPDGHFTHEIDASIASDILYKIHN